jgi:competence protein ComEC
VTLTVRDAGSDRRRAAEIDLRLAAGAVTAWLALLACRSCSPAGALRVGLVGMAAGAVALLFGGSVLGRVAAVVGLLGWCTAGVVLPLAARLYAVRASPVTRLALARTAAVVDLTVVADPRPVGGAPAGTDRVVIDATLHALTLRGHAIQVAGRIAVFAPATAWAAVLPGQRVRADGRLAPPADPLSVATLTVRYPPTLLGRPPSWQLLAGRVRTGLQRASTVLPGDARGLLPGLVIGDTSGLDPVLGQRFKAAGLTHLVAVSGANCVIVVGTVLLVMRRLRAPPVLASVVAGAALAGFVLVARPSPSVVRAAVMAGIALAAFASGRPRAGVPMVSAAALICLVWQPAWASEAGFAMSVLATVALLVVAPGWATTLRQRRVPPVIAESIAVAAAAHLCTAPIVVMISGRLSLVAIPANVLAEPAVAPATVLGVIAALISTCWLQAAQAVVWLAGWPVRWLVWDADSLGGLSGGTIAWPASVTGALLLIAAFLAGGLSLRFRRIRPSLAVAGLVAFVVQVPVGHLVTRWPPRHWIVIACDVGQGDSLLLPAGRHAAVVVDTGPDPIVEDRCLRDAQVRVIPLLVVTHLHLDHVGGIAGALRGRRVGAVLTGPLDEPAAGLAIAVHALGPRELTLRVPAPGTVLSVGSVRLIVLGPTVAFHGTRSDPNNSSLVLRAEVAGRRILLPGDAELAAQQSLLSAGVDLRADVLKVSHHGSAYSDRRFVAAVGARLAVISVGAHNDYGHPAPSLLAMLTSLALPVLRTDRDGDIAVTSAAGRLMAVHRAHHGIGALSPVGSLGPIVRTAGEDAVSAGGGRMPGWPRPRRTRPGGLPPGPASCCWSARKSSSRRAPSSRSPPPSVPPKPRPRSPSGSAAA